MEKDRFSFTKRAKSFRYAFDGIKYLLKHEHNARIHICALILVIVAGIMLDLSTMEWIAVIIVSGAVFTAEAMNTAIEKIADIISPEYNEKIKPVKDVAAGAVLFMAIAAAITGLLVFVPKIIVLLAL